MTSIFINDQEILLQPAGWIGPWEIGVLLVVVLTFLFPLFALIDILSSDFETNDKLMWVIVVLFLPFLGSILYFIIGIKKKKKL